MNFYPKPTKLIDCACHGLDSDTELFIVEGDSASRSVARIRRSHDQAVLPMQGKPMNAYKASHAAVEKNDLYSVLIDSLGAGWHDNFRLENLRYSRVILLFDPDADGIHCGALMLMFFHRWMPELLASDRLLVIHPPLYEITAAKFDDVVHAHSEQHFARVREALEAKKIVYKSKRFRGLASMSDETLYAQCIDPETRRAHVLKEDDAFAAVDTFVGKRLL